MEQTKRCKKNSNRYGQAFRRRHFENEEGMSIVMALLFLVLLAALVPFAVHKTTQDTSNTADFQTDKKHFFLADSGIQAGKNLLYSSAIDGLDTELSTNSGVMLSNVAFANGTYTVTATDNNDGDADTNADLDDIIFLTSQATINGETKTIRALVRAGIDTWTAPGGIITDGDLNISGNPNILGTLGNVHTNGNINSSGNAVVAENITAHGTTTVNNPGNIAGTITDGVPVVDIPPDVNNLVQLSTWMSSYVKPYADFVFDDTGKVYDSVGNVIGDLGGAAGDWLDANGEKWVFNGSNQWSYGDGGIGVHPVDGMYYFVDTSVVIGGAPTGWVMTLVAEGHVEISGNPEFTNYMDASDPAGVQNMTLMALYDLKLNGNANQNVVGLLYAGQQFDIGGNPNVNGSLIAKDFNTSVQHGIDHVGTSSVSGDMTLTYSGGMDFPPDSTNVQVSTLSWREQ